MSKKILLVDDSKIVLSLHTYILENAGYEVRCAPNGFTALEFLFTEAFDLVITDVNMPRMDGYALIERIRQEEDFQSLPIIIISTEEEAADKQKGFDAGANVYIVKPAKPKDLILNLEMLLRDSANV